MPDEEKKEKSIQEVNLKFKMKEKRCIILLKGLYG